MKKLLNFMAGLFLFAIYIQSRLLFVPVFWRGFPAFELWVDEPIGQDVFLILTAYVIIAAFYFFTWWIVMSVIIAIAATVLITNIIRFRSWKRKITEKDL